MPIRHILLAVLVAALGGLNFVAATYALESFPPLLLVGFRFAFVVFPAALFLPRPPIPWRLVAAVGSTLGAGQVGLLVLSIHFGMPAGLASLVVQLNVVFTIAVAVVALNERPTRAQLAGAAVAVAGITVIGADRAHGGLPLGAFLLCVAGAASWGIGNVVTRIAQAPNALALTVWSGLFAAPPLFVLSLAIDGPARIGAAVTGASAKSIAALAFSVVGVGMVGIMSWVWLLRRYEASRIAPFGLLVPVFGIGTAWLFLGERPGLLELVGAAIVIAGVAIVTAGMRLLHRPAITPLAVDAVPEQA